MKRTITLIALILSFGLVQNASAQLEVYTGTPKEVHATDATVMGTVNIFDLSGIVFADFSTDSNNLNQMSQIVPMFGFVLTPVTIDITNLLPSTTYYVRLHAVNSFADSVGNVVSFTTLASTTGFNEVNASTLALYPNPAKDVLNIAVKSPGITNCEVYNLAGQKVIEATLNGINNTVDVSMLQNGTYFLRTQNGSAGSMERFIILR